jgi:hypothetical protein
VPQLQGPKADAFIHNSISYAATRFRIDSSTPISEIAYHLRKATIEALQPQEMEASMAIIRELTRRGQSIHICEPLDRSYNISSWSGAWKGIDFACAAIKDTAAATGEEAVGAEKNVPKPEMMVLGSAAWRGQFQRCKLPCAPVLRTATRLTTATVNSVIMCKANNGYWCDFAMNEQSLKLVKEYLKKDPQLKEL